LTHSSKKAIVDQNFCARIRLPRRNQYPLFFSIVVLALILAACRAPSQDRPKGYLVAGIESNPLQLDPRYSTDANSVRIGNLIYNSLLRYDERSQLQSELAENWRMLDDRTYVLDLRQDVNFHNGKRLTAADVKYTYESILDPNSLSPKRGLLRPLEAIDQIGSHQLRFRLRAPHAPFIEQFTMGIVPAAAGKSAVSNYEPPPGSGPFRLETLESGEKVTLRANANYWEGRPGLAGVVFKIVPDALVRVLEFKQGSIDFMQNDLEPEMLPWLKHNTDARVEMNQGTTFQYIGINLTHPILRHRKVRQAIACAIDRDSVIRHLLKNIVSEATGLLSPHNWAYDESARRWPYNPARARQLLDEAGFIDPDGDGPRPRFRLSFKTTNIDLRRRIAEAFKEQLLQVGIEIELRSYEWGTFFSDIKSGNFHLYSLAWVGIEDPDIYHQIFHSSSVPPNGDNRGRYRNSDVDRLLEQGRVTLDRSERQVIYRDVQRLLAEDLPYVPLWWWKNVIVKQPGLRGFVAYPDGELISLKKATFG
jgi:peptide/nickel transport system substrate-binding protein